MIQSDRRQGGPGRPALPELTLTAAETAPFAPGQRAQLVAILTDMILSYLEEQRQEAAGLPAAQADAYRPEERPGRSLAP